MKITPEEFIKWLTDFLEGRDRLTPRQTEEVNQKLNMVFNKITPNPSPLLSNVIEIEGNFLVSDNLKDCSAVENRLIC